jgi:hypothetical protein
MSTTSHLRLRLTLLWGLLTVVVLGAFSAPMLLNDIDFPFWVVHCTFIVVFLTAVRYIFFLRHSFLASRQIMKIALFFICIWGVFLLVNEVYGIRTYADETGFETFLGHLPNADYSALSEFILTEMVFFGTASIISTTILAIRLILSVWRWHNFKKA